MTVTSPFRQLVGPGPLSSLRRAQRAGTARGGAPTGGDFDPVRACAYISHAMAWYRPERSSACRNRGLRCRGSRSWPSSLLPAGAPHRRDRRSRAESTVRWILPIEIPPEVPASGGAGARPRGCDSSTGPDRDFSSDSASCGRKPERAPGIRGPGLTPCSVR
jgi:hypothetical protein